MSTRVYEESSSVLWARVLYVVAIVFAALVAFLLTAGRDLLDEPNGSLGIIIPSGLVVVFVGIGWTASRYFVRFDGEQLRFGFSHWNKCFPTSAIAGARSESVSLWTFGGAGWRIGRGGRIGYIRWFGPAVEVDTPKRRYVFSCRDPDAMLAALKQAGVATEAASASAG
ncbi:MAG: PH domain-containing protein [Planctomycetota bacterium]|jgi:hypothetical protein